MLPLANDVALCANGKAKRMLFTATKTKNKKEAIGALAGRIAAFGLL